ncbi:hypothetical protein G7Y79_00038g074660 [Physcia stellaris]|nr:hypothetical protein G7Y79_00038g074660 [Physcia stellaris]
MSNMEITALQEQVTASDAEIDSLEHQLAEVSQQLAEVSQRLADSQASERSLKRQLRKFHASEGSRSVSTTQAQSPVSSEAQEAAELRVRELEAQIDSLTQSSKLRVEELESSNQSLTSDKKALTSDKKALTSENKELSRLVDEQAANFDQMTSEIKTLKTGKEDHRETLQSGIESLRSLARVFEAQVNKDKAVTKKEDSNRGDDHPFSTNPDRFLVIVLVAKLKARIGTVLNGTTKKF